MQLLTFGAQAFPLKREGPGMAGTVPGHRALQDPHDGK